MEGVKGRERVLELCLLNRLIFLGMYEEDSQWMTQINRLQKLIDRLEKKVTIYT